LEESLKPQNKIVNISGLIAGANRIIGSRQKCVLENITL
jgi:hypothetical protein